MTFNVEAWPEAMVNDNQVTLAYAEDYPGRNDIVIVKDYESAGVV